jgi:two-component system sensor histidine kinase BaeS
VLSSLAVIGGAVVAGLLLAGRLAKPIRQIKAATAAIAAGNLDARVEPTGSDELADLGHEVNRMAADLQRSKALDRQFLMSVSHDLKTPLTAISGYAEGLSDGAISNTRAAGQVIGNHARRLDRLVGDLLDLARLDSNRFRLNIRPFDLSVLTGRTVAGLANHAAGHGLTLVRDGLETITVSADSDRTAQAIGNLVDNAIKFATSTVTVGVGTYGDGWAVVSVRDDGPGIAEGDLPYIFDRLYTGRAQPERAENPTGLGLAIVRELANAMGGTVTAANNPGGGACISLLLPIGGPGSEPGRHESAPPPPLTNS